MDNITLYARQRGAISAAYAAALLGLVYLFMKSALMGAPTVDFKYFWLAGDLWRDGVSPYSQAFAERAAETFPQTNHAQIFPYPPNWWLVSSTLALMPHDLAAWIWRTISAVLTFASIALAWRAIRPREGFLHPLFAASLAYAFLMSATPMNLAIGQNAAVMLFGLAFVIFGACSQRPWALAAGIVVLMLKPQLGAPVAAYFLMQKDGWKTVGAAALVTFVMCAPAFFSSLPAELTTDFLHQVSIYDTQETAFAVSMTGARNITLLLTGADISSAWFALASLAAGFAIGALCRGNGLPLLIGSVLFITPLHTYDLVLAAPLLIFSFAMTGVAQWLLWAGLAIIFRANNIAAATGLHYADTLSFPGASVASIGLLAILAGVLADARSKKA
ncbi:glycosyltransferase family 87 protein [Hyphococcus luteus]|uniref:DUF2029 domain-containing protein n=1 Tax=Hyphococcus luteus TaxID=2058213 RepID=A0A2S7K0Z9_9PROT|nr:glycosyltransferase family 87 protein [Marinicaulis flavus]PQA86179.1 hypothetical protein CW354_17635 [Marinicaulis flavus]